ncbi:histamine H2 receptor-like [Dendronephthya gigantea]|uniref:histamine H2 receptor-like n=1 Tax=Dendronephthya gigantea TaxID=151771 RepID=UPI00106AC071|nr:histamine H2 receptor-like [Dendronephthya gigantea]
MANLLNGSTLTLVNTTLKNSILNSTLNRTVSSTAPALNPVYDTFLIIQALVIIAINGLVIFLFIWKPFLKEITNYFLVSLAISDGLTGLVVIPLYYACFLTGHVVEICFSFDMVHRMTAFSTVYHLLLITCDRYVAITRPFRHSSTFTSTVGYLLLTVVWSAALFLPLIQLAWYDPYNLKKSSMKAQRYELHYNITCAVIAFLVPVVIMILAYAEMLRIVTRHARAIEATSRQQQALTKEKRAMVIFASMLLVYIVCWFTFFFSSLAQDLAPNFLHVPEYVYLILFFLRFCTSIINPILYVFFKTDFKKALREIVTQYKCSASTVTGFLLQNHSVSNNEEDDSSSPRAPMRQYTSRTRN